MLAFAFGAKIHLPIVQIAGWAGMTANYARLMPLDEAVETAISGRELCGVCDYVRNAEHTKRATDAVFAQSVATVLLAPLPGRGTIAVVVPESERASWHRPANRFAASRDGLPEPPPPKAAV